MNKEEIINIIDDFIGPHKPGLRDLSEMGESFVGDYLDSPGQERDFIKINLYEIKEKLQTDEVELTPEIDSVKKFQVKNEKFYKKLKEKIKNKEQREKLRFFKMQKEEFKNPMRKDKL